MARFVNAPVVQAVTGGGFVWLASGTLGNTLGNTLGGHVVTAADRLGGHVVTAADRLGKHGENVGASAGTRIGLGLGALALGTIAAARRAP